MAEIDWESGRITEAGLEFMRSEIGVSRPAPGWNRLVTTEGVEHFALGIGDDNPLWWDEAYAAASPHGGRVAPPCYLYSHAGGPRLRPEHGHASTDRFLPGVMGLLAGEKWRWRRLPRVGETVRAESALVDVSIREGGFGGRSVAQVERISFIAGDEVIAEQDQTIRRFERGQTRERSAYLDRPQATWTEADRERFEAQYEAEIAARRGASPRFVEEVRPGDTIGPMLKGPLTITGMIGFLLGAGSGNTPTNRMTHSYLKLHPGGRLIHPDTGIADTLKAAHFEPALARASGMPTGYDFGVARVSWFSHLLTDWAGDDGRLVELEAQIRRPNFLGDVTWLSGEVVSTDPEAGEVAISLVARNQLEETTAVGAGKVRLPRRPQA